MEALLQALYHEKDSGHFFRTYLKKSNNRVNDHIFIKRETTVEKRQGGGGRERVKERGREGETVGQRQRV